MSQARRPDDRFETIARAIREGRTGEAARRLEEIAKNRLKRAERLSAASLSYRCGLPLLGLKLLGPVLRPRVPVHPRAQPTEIATYSACLIQLGGAEEARRLLTDLDPAEEPRAPFFAAAAYMSQWRYEEALPELRRFLALPKIDPYLRLVGEVNLLASLLACNHLDESKALLDCLQEATNGDGLSRLKMNVLELGAQYHLAKGAWSSMEECLDRASLCSVDEGSRDRLFVKKWRAVSEARRLGNSRPLVSVRTEAESKSHWETVRECDRYSALFDEDEALLKKVYFGTPYSAYRAALLKEFSREVEIPGTFLWQRGKGGPELDLTGESPAAGTPLPRTLLRLLLILSRDHYAPIRLVELALRLFPGELFNPRSSPARVHQSVLRSRLLLRKERLPLIIEQLGGSYRLNASGPIAIRVPRDDAGEDASVTIRLRAAFGERPFSIQEAASILRRPLRSVQREVTVLTEANVLQRTGKARATLYRVLKRT